MAQGEVNRRRTIGDVDLRQDVGHVILHRLLGEGLDLVVNSNALGGFVSTHMRPSNKVGRITDQND